MLLAVLIGTVCLVQPSHKNEDGIYRWVFSKIKDQEFATYSTNIDSLSNIALPCVQIPFLPSKMHVPTNHVSGGPFCFAETQPDNRYRHRPKITLTSDLNFVIATERNTELD